MEAIAAIALLCNVFDLAERTYKCFQKARQAYESTTGLPQEHQRLLESTNELAAVLGEIQSRGKKLDEIKDGDANIQAVADKCKDLSSSITVLLEKCRSKKPRSRLDSIGVAVKSVRYGKRLQTQKIDLDKSRETLHLALTASAVVQINNVQKILDQERVENQNLRQELNDVQRKLNTLNDISDQLQQTLSLCQQAQKARELHAILQILADNSSEKSNPRYDEVFDASAGTFDWILSDPAKLYEVEPGTELTFVNWLREGDGIFHVLGKPGAGKSTLMKLVWGHEVTTKMLNEWAGDAQLLRMKYFFWKLEPSQSGLRGLKSSLLSSMLEQAPELLDTLLPGPKKDCIRYEQLLKAFDHLLGSPKALGQYKVFLLIDGLDEFDGKRDAKDYDDLVCLLQTWVSRSEGKIKICVSSREYAEFTAMTSRQKIRLQNLTNKDMTTYVTERVTTHPRFAELEQSCEGSHNHDCYKSYDESHNWCPEYLITHIVDISDGVFLWVRLVMGQVRKDLTAGYSLYKIWEHVNSQPKPLEDFIKHMLDSITTSCQRQAYIILSIVLMYKVNETWAQGQRLFVSLQGASYLYDKLDRVGNTRLNPFHYDRIDPDTTLPHEACWHILTADEITARFNGLLEVSEWVAGNSGPRIQILTFTHRSIVELLQDNLATKLTEHGITEAELCNWICQITTSELISIFDPFNDNSIQLDYLHSRLRCIFRLLGRRSLFEEHCITGQLERLEDTYPTRDFRVSQFPEEYLRRLASLPPFAKIVHWWYTEALPWILKWVREVPEKRYLASFFVHICTVYWDIMKGQDRKDTHLFLTTFLQHGFIDFDLRDEERKEHVYRYGFRTTEPWVYFVWFLFATEIKTRIDWTIAELWLDQGANPRIRIDPDLFMSVNIDGKWVMVHRILRLVINRNPTSQGTFEELIARSDASNKERLLELVRRNTDMIEAEEAADATVEPVSTSL